jgi:hypothetical protein
MSRFHRFLLVTFAAALCIAPEAAPAGTYTVRSCWGTGDTSGWTPLVKGNSLDFRQYCEGTDMASKPGLGVWTGPRPWPLDLLQGSSWTFTAPPQTRIVGLSGEYAYTSDPAFVALGVVMWAGLWDVDGVEAGWAVTPSATWRPFSFANMSVERLGVGLRCWQPFAGYCYLPFGYDYNRQDPRYQQGMTVRRTTLTISDDVKPTVSVLQGVPSGWHGDEQLPISFTAGDNVGVAALEMQVDGRKVNAHARGCYEGSPNQLPAPCGSPGPPLLTTVDTSALTDGQHEVRLTARDVVGNAVTETLLLSTDGSAPGAPRALRLADNDAWRPINRFDVSWSNPTADGAPVAAADYELCPARNQPYDSSGCVTGRRTGQDIARIDDLSVPSSGEWRLRVALRDAAGNLDRDRSAELGGLRLDGDLPSASFLPFDSADPARVQLAAADDTSGVAAVDIEARRRGDAVWHALPVLGSGDHYSAVLDDDQLPEGLYDLRARVVDRAGNERSTMKLAGGSAFSVRLPVRVATALVVGEPHRVRVKSSKSKRPVYRRVLVTKPEAKYGDPVSVEGRLTDSAGNAQAGATIRVLERVGLPGRDWMQLATVTSDASGTFKFRALPGPARVLRFVFPGTATSRPRTEDVEVRVRAGVTLRPSRRRVDNGDDVVFRGRVLGKPIPEAGKLLVLQARTPRGWRTFATPRARGQDGRWSYRYEFAGTPVTTRYSFRVVAQEDSSYPYASGASKVATVLVRGGG